MCKYSPKVKDGEDGPKLEVKPEGNSLKVIKSQLLFPEKYQMEALYFCSVHPTSRISLSDKAPSI